MKRAIWLAVVLLFGVALAAQAQSTRDVAYVSGNLKPAVVAAAQAQTPAVPYAKLVVNGNCMTCTVKLYYETGGCTKPTGPSTLLTPMPIVAPTTAAPYISPQLNWNTAYCAWATYVNAAGESAASPGLTVTVGAQPGSAPAAPTGVSVTIVTQ